MSLFACLQFFPLLPGDVSGGGHLAAGQGQPTTLL